MVIKAIILDVGGVLVNETAQKARDKISKKYNFSSEEFTKVFRKYLDYSYTGWHYNSFFQKLVEELNLDVSYNELAKEWLKIREETSSINEQVRKIIFILKEKYLVGMLSNSTILNEKATARRETLSLFDEEFRLTSCKIGFRKPNKKSYEFLLEKLKLKKIKSNETIFVDDKEENLIPAKELGFNTILFKNAEQLKSDLIKLGIKI